MIVACIKWTQLRVDIDPVHATVSPTNHGAGISAADASAIEVALRLGETLGQQVTVLTVGPAAADAALRDALASGADRVIRIDSGTDAPSDQIALALTEELTVGSVAVDGPLSFVVCGDVSSDRGSGAVPAYLADELGASQALGLIEVDTASAAGGTLQVLRRLDGGRRERLAVTVPAVLSVEGGVVDPRRAPLAAVLRAESATVEVVAPRVQLRAEQVRLTPWRPRARVVPSPTGDHALSRIVALTGALSDRTPPRTLTLEPAAAAATIIEQLREWGYLDGDPAGLEP